MLIKIRMMKMPLVIKMKIMGIKMMKIRTMV